MSDVTILIVEDNADNRDIYTTILRHHGYRVEEAETGEDGLVQAARLLPALILMDVSMPGMDGLEATRRLKADPATAGIPVIAVTAHAMAEDRAKAVAAGCDGYLAKPVEPRRVLEEVGRLLAEFSEAAAEQPRPA